jgi:hypothetical protein
VVVMLPARKTTAELLRDENGHTTAELLRDENGHFLLTSLYTYPKSSANVGVEKVLSRV